MRGSLTPGTINELFFEEIWSVPGIITNASPSILGNLTILADLCNLGWNIPKLRHVQLAVKKLTNPSFSPVLI